MHLLDEPRTAAVDRPARPGGGVVAGRMGVMPSAAAMLVLVVTLPAAADAPPLGTIRDVAESYLRPGPPGPVDLEAVVLGRRFDGVILIRDDTGATFVQPAGEPAVAAGDRVRVRGSVKDGVIINGIAGATLERIGAGPVPEPREIGPDDLAAGTFYHDLVTTRGTVRSVQRLAATSGSGTLLILNVPGGSIEVRSDVAIPGAEGLVDAEVLVTGYGGGEANAARQVLRPFVRVVDPGGVRIEAPGAEPFAAAAVPLEQLGRGLRSGHRVRVSGVATAPGGTGGGLFLAAGDRGLFVAPAGGDGAIREIAPGDVVEASGFATPGPAALFLGDAIVRVTGTAAVPPAERLPDPTSRETDWEKMYAEIWRDALPVEIEITLLSRVDRDEGVELVGSTPIRRMKVRCVVPGKPSADAVPGSLVRVRGVCRVMATDRDAFKPLPNSFDIWARAPGDVAVVRAAVWWQRPWVVRSLAAVLAAAAVTIAGTAAWIVFLRRQVRRQVGVIEGKLRAEAVFEERQRIAREFHDSLEQDLAAMALRLDAAAESLAAGEARDVLDGQRAAVLRLQDESHHFVWDLRDAALADRPLAESLAALVDDQRHLSPAPIGLRIEGPLPNPPLAVRQHLLRIVREAVANAVSHAHAATIDVTASATPGGVRVEVRDDGEGFDVAACERKAGHFGLRGMRERAWRTGATLEVESSPRSGTRVVVSVGTREPGGGEQAL